MFLLRKHSVSTIIFLMLFSIISTLSFAQSEKGASSDRDISVEENPDIAFNSKQEKKNRKDLLVFFNSKQYFSAKIEQKTKDGESILDQTGKIYFAKPSSFRFELNGVDSQTVVSNGKKVWRYYPNLDQVVINNVTVANRENIPLLLMGSHAQRILSIFSVVLMSSTGEKKHYRLFPIKYESFEFVDIVIESKELKSIVIAYNDKRFVSLSFDKISYRKLDKSLFHFIPQKGVEVIAE